MATCVERLAGSFSGEQAQALCAQLSTNPGRSLLDVDAIQDGSTDVFFLTMSAYLVFFMQTGFGMLCAGSVRSKNVINILLKNVIDACGGAVAFYLFGYGFAYGVPLKDTKDCVQDGNPSSFIGEGNFALTCLIGSHQSWLFQWAFAAAAATIVSGSVAERCTFEAYLTYSCFLTGFIYPVVVHWVWDVNGWLGGWLDDGGLKKDKDDLLLGTGMLDFAGSGVVHMVGGVAGLCGAAILGPRSGRFFADGSVKSMPGHSSPLIVLGTFILWVGWYGFNPGSQLGISGAVSPIVVSRTAVTTTLGAASGGLTALGLMRMRQGYWDLMAVCGGLLAGLVSVTAGCSIIEPWAALLVGGIGAAVFQGSDLLLLKLKIDDPLQAAPMHGFAGAWGCIAVGLLAKEQYVAQVYGRDGGSFDMAASTGVFYGGDGSLLGCQIIGVICIALWVAGCCVPMFFALKMMGILRVPPADEDEGLDVSHHGGLAYPDEFSTGK